MPLIKRTPEAKPDAAHIWRYIAEKNFDAPNSGSQRLTGRSS
jgi:hypothetical protein